MKQNYCPCCGQPDARPICRLGPVPVMVNQLCRTREEARAVPKSEIALAQCKNCGVVWNLDYQPEKLTYDAQYENSQDLGKAYQAHFDNVFSFLSSHISLKGKRVLEIGCGKGHFLRQLAERTGCIAFGADPSWLGEEGSCVIYKEPYSEALAHRLGEGAFDCILLRQVLDQLSTPLSQGDGAGGLMGCISANLCEGGFLYIEGPDFHYLQENRSLLDLSYERYTYFTTETLGRVMQGSGIGLEAEMTSFEGQYMAVIGRKRTNDGTRGNPSAAPMAPWDTAQMIRQAHAKLEQLAGQGKIALWGAANRGVMFSNLLDADAARIDCIIDILPRKQGGFLPGTGHLILPPTEAAARKIRFVIAANRNYQPEITAQLQEMGSTASVVSAEQFFEPSI